MSNPSGNQVDADKLKEFLKKRRSSSVAEEVEVIDEANTDGSNDQTQDGDGFSGLPEFENVAVPPMRRPQAFAAARAGVASGTTGGMSAEKMRDLERLIQQVRLIGVAAIMLLSLLVMIEIAKPLAGALMPTSYDYLVYDLKDETQSDVKDELEIEGWELVSFGFGSAIYKRPK